MPKDAKQPRLLLICCRPKDLLKDSPLPEHQAWFERIMDLRSGTLETVYAADMRYPDLNDYDGVIIGGSKHSVYENLPWIPPLEEFVRHVFDLKKPYFGVCFGHQIAVTALGGEVTFGTNGSEVGPTEIRLTEAGKRDPLFTGMPDVFRVAEFHRDVVTKLPEHPDLVQLAQSAQYPTQAFAYGQYARTVQFHPEFSKEIISYIIEQYAEELVSDGFFSSQKEMQSLATSLWNRDFEENGTSIARNFYSTFLS